MQVGPRYVVTLH